MIGNPYRLSMVLLVVAGLTWTAAVQAFFCFSMGGGKRQQRPYSYPLPYRGFGRFDIQTLPYSPARPNMQINQYLPPREETFATPVPLPAQQFFK
jgi:hypothetical protein